jgi:hypothetical protein
MTSEKIFYAILALLFAIISIVTHQIIGEVAFAAVFALISFLASAKALDLNEWLN